MLWEVGLKFSKGDEIDRRTLDRREPSRSDQNLDGGLPVLVDGLLVAGSLGSGEAAKPEGGRDASGLRGYGREIGASSLRCRGLDAVEDLGEKDPNNDSRRLRSSSTSSTSIAGLVFESLLLKERPCWFSPDEPVAA